MKTFRPMAAVFLALTAFAGAQAPLDALTGTYSGTLVHEHSLKVIDAPPSKTVKFKQTVRVAGLGYVPAGHSRTTITLILPAERFFNPGVDRKITIDFEPNPPVATVHDGTGDANLGFPAVTVSGKVVTVVVNTSGTIVNNNNLIESDNRTLKIVRTKP